MVKSIHRAVTIWDGRHRSKAGGLGQAEKTYNCRYSKLLFAGMLEKSQDVISDNDTRFSAEHISNTHFDED